MGEDKRLNLTSMATDGILCITGQDLYKFGEEKSLFLIHAFSDALVDPLRLDSSAFYR